VVRPGFPHGEISIRTEISKSRKDRTIPMNKPVADALRGWPKSKSGLVFFNKDTGPHVRDPKTAFHTACRKAKITGASSHTLRHTALTRMIEAGVDIVTVKEIAGHSSIETTMRYWHPSRETRAQAMGKLAEAFLAAGTAVQDRLGIRTYPFWPIN
jgi:integrase